MVEEGVGGFFNPLLKNFLMATLHLLYHDVAAVDDAMMIMEMMAAYKRV